MPDLTKGAERVLCTAYKMCLERNDTSITITLDEISSEKSLSMYSKVQIEEYIGEIEEADYCESYIDSSFKLSTSAIIRMEHKFSDDISKVDYFLFPKNNPYYLE